MGKKLELARIEKELSQLELAQEVGLSQGMIGKYERGINRIPPDVLQKISRVLEKPISYFYGEDESPDNIREILKNFVKEGEGKYRTSGAEYQVPFLDELYSTNILEQIALARHKYVISPNIADEKDSCFAIKTSNLGSIDIDIAVDTTIVVSTNISPINGDKVLIFHNDMSMIRTYYKKGDMVEFTSSNPMFSEPIAKSESYKIVGVIIVMEKRL